MEEFFKVAASCREKSTKGNTNDPLGVLLQKKKVVIMDGGYSNELANVLGRSLNTTLWTAEVLTNDDLMRKGEEVHRRYVDSGSDIVLSAGYQASFEGFQKEGYTEADSSLFLQRSVEICKKASPLVAAASFGPYAASLADGSEYDPKYNNVEAVPMLMKWHKRKLNAIMKASPEYLAFETIPCPSEVAAITSLLQEEDYPAAYISVSCRDGSSLNCGASLLETLRLLFKYDINNRIRGIGVNCTEPEYIPSNLEIISKVISEQSREVYIVCYPNAGKKWDGEKKEWVSGSGTSAEDFAEQAKTWVEMGARVIGGCCETGCETIAVLKSKLTQ
eukprot:TRINITY_DN28071_c0_g1_i1.p1 TRINITY_DN28071_c0_g1~~TRINITY_DN28071_c0_g1_i1.p1  ORF type:complete len:333 (+),score=57.97 TRINITY_DN28071_c0_g1_i1:63-1061(+)